LTDEGHVISVEIQGQRYPIRSALEEAYVARLATYVDEKMRTATETTPTGDSLRLAVLVALTSPMSSSAAAMRTARDRVSWPNGLASSNASSTAS